MRLVIDYDTVVSTNPTMYAQIVKLLIEHKMYPVLTTSHHNAADADEWAYHNGVREVFVISSGKQHQDILSADLWFSGRVDRIVGKEQVTTLYQKYDRKSSPDDYH